MNPLTTPKSRGMVTPSENNYDLVQLIQGHFYPMSIISLSKTNIQLICGIFGGRSGLMVSALDSGASAPCSSPGQGHCVVFLGKTLHPQSASLHPGV